MVNVNLEDKMSLPRRSGTEDWLTEPKGRGTSTCFSVTAVVPISLLAFSGAVVLALALNTASQVCLFTDVPALPSKSVEEYI
jgi:hypothetical protein